MASYGMWSLGLGPLSRSTILVRPIVGSLCPRIEAWPPPTGAQGPWERALTRGWTHKAGAALYFPGVAGASVKLLQGDTGQGSKPLKVCIPQLEQR